MNGFGATSARFRTWSRFLYKNWITALFSSRPVADTSCPLFETAATTRKNFVTDSSTAAEGIEKCCPARRHDEPFAVSVPFQPAVFYWNILWIFPCSSAHLRSGFEL